MTQSQLHVQPLSAAIGAEIHGVDLSRPLDEETVSAIRAAWLKHLVIFFRGQELTPQQQLDFAHCIGEPMAYPFVQGLPDQPLITPVVKLEHETKNFGGIWHSDTTYLSSPPMGTLLLARELPASGGDTLFANMYLAYESLSRGMRSLLDDLVALNSSRKADASSTREDMRSKASRDDAPQVLEAEHRVVRVHPETGRKALYVNVGHTERFKDMTVAESRPILEFLFEHLKRPEFCCRFVWTVGSLILWDNRCAQHYPVNDYHGSRRVMHRITLRG